MNILCLDFETSINKTIHGSTFRDPANDIYTQIFGYEDKNVTLLHNKDGFKRKLPSGCLDDIDLVIGHNLSFDLSYVWQDSQIKDFILRGGRIWDTQVAEYLLSGQQHKFSSLAELQLKYLEKVEKPSRISYLYKKKIGADEIVKRQHTHKRLWKLYEEYCITDGVTPIKICKEQLARAKQFNMIAIIELYNDYLLSIINMTDSGIKVDIDKTEETLRDFELKHLEYLEEAQNIVKQFWTDERLPVFNINSNDHKSAVLFGGNVKCVVKKHVGLFKNGKDKYKNVEELVNIQGFRVPTSITTESKKSGFYKTDDKTMKEIALRTKNPSLKKYCELQKEAMMYKKAAKTYCQAFIDRSISEYLRPHFNNTLTETSRLSCKEPNLQNVSKRNKFGKILHSLFVAPKGWKCVQIDFSQLEIFVLAWLSDDEQLRKDLLSGIDLHIVRLQYYNEDKTYDELYKLCKIDKDPHWDHQRSLAKTVSYQSAYGAQVKKIAQTTGLSEDVIKEIFEKESLRYPNASKLHEQVTESIEQTAFFSLARNIPAALKKGTNGSRIHNNVELMPIFDKNGNVVYNQEYVRRVGFWTSPTGKRYHFLNSGRVFRGQVNTGFSFTQPKNYPMQGSAADVQGITTAALLRALLLKSDKIKMINEVHDSKWFYVREDVLEPCLKYLKETIEDVPKLMKQRFNIELPFKFPVDIEVGDNFGDMNRWEAL